MALNNIGILIALCTLAVAIDQEVKSPPENEESPTIKDPNFHFQLQSTSEEGVPRKGHQNHKPYFPHSSEQSEEHQEKWEHKKPHHHSSYIPYFPHHHDYQNENTEGLERRRPIFFPYHPYHPYYPYAHPSTNDQEFETIEAIKRGTYHGPHNPNFPLGQDNSQEYEDHQKRPFYHGQHHPHFPFSFDSSEESSEEILHRPFFHIPHFKPFHKEPYPSESSEKDCRIPSIIIDIYNLLHHGHGKPHDKFPLIDNGLVEEGSGNVEIIPLSNTEDISLVKDDMQEEVEDEEEPSNVDSRIDLRSFLKSRK